MARGVSCAPAYCERERTPLAPSWMQRAAAQCRDSCASEWYALGFCCGRSGCEAARHRVECCGCGKHELRTDQRHVGYSVHRRDFALLTQEAQDGKVERRSRKDPEISCSSYSSAVRSLPKTSTPARFLAQAVSSSKTILRAVW